MKRSSVVLVLILLVTSSGCQQCLSRFRGARCRPGLPSLRWPRRAQEPVAPYNTGCPQPNVAGAPCGTVPNGVMTVAPGTVIEGQAITPTPIDGQYIDGATYNGTYLDGQIQVDRPVISSTVAGPVVTAPTNGSVMTVPGPESAPLPN